MRILFILVLFFSFLFSNSDINLKLKWKHQFQFAGFYMALEKGYYDTDELNVSFDELSNENPVDDVIQNDLTFGIGDSTLVYEKLAGKPIVSLAAIFQESPLALITLRENGINSPLDLKEKTIEISSFFEKKLPLYVFLKSFGVNYREKEVTFGVEDLINKKTDAISGYIVDKPYELAKRGYESTILHPKDFGYDFYGDILYTSEATLKKYPKKVDAFVKASILGWKYAFSNIDETVDVILKKYNTQNKSRDELIYEAKALKELAGNLNKFGELDLNKIKNIASIFSVLLPNKYDFTVLDTFVLNYKNLHSSIYHKDLSLLENEKKFLQRNNTFSVCVNNNIYPLSGYKNGKLVGVMGEFYRHIGETLDIDFVAINSKSYYELSENIKENNCDFIDFIDENQSDFTNIKSSKKLKTLNFVSIGKANILNQKQMKDVTFYIKSKRYEKSIKKYNPNLNTVYEPNEVKILNEISKDPKNQYLITVEESRFFQNEYKNLNFDVTYLFDNIKYDFSLGINKNKPELVSIIDKFIENEDIKYLRSIIDDYFKYLENNTFNKINNYSLTHNELEFLKNQELEIYLTNWEPFGYVVDSKPDGFSVKYFEKLFENTGLKYSYILNDNFTKSLNKIKENPNGLIVSTSRTNSKFKEGIYSIPYKKFQIGLVTKDKKNFIYDYNSLNGKKIAVGKYFSAYEILKTNYPKIDFVFTQNTIEALKLVSDGEVYGAVDILPVLDTLLNKYLMNDLKITGLSKEYFNLQFMANKNNTQLLIILNKLIANFDEGELYNLENKYLRSNVIERFDENTFYSILIFLVFIISILLVTQYQSTRHKRVLLKEKEKYFTIMKNASDGIHILDEKGNVVDCNYNFALSLGYTLEEAKQLNVSDWEAMLIGSSSVDMIKELIKKPIIFATKHKRKDGSIIDVEINTSTIEISGKQFLYASSRDISELKKSNLKIEQLNTQLNNLNKSLEQRIDEAVIENSKQQALMIHQNRLSQLGEMVSMIAHQWRQPLSALSVWVSNLSFIVKSGNYTNEEVEQIESKIKNILIHLSETIDEFKNYYKTNNRKVDFNLKKSIEDTLIITNSSISSSNVKLNLELEDDIKIFGFENQLKQVLVALISNSVDASNNSDIKRIDIYSKLNENEVEIYVEDYAGGIPEKIKNKVFDPYFSTKTDLNGSGLGLYMAKMIIEKSFNGTINFTNSEKGTIFVLKFPLEESDNKDLILF